MYIKKLMRIAFLCLLLVPAANSFSQEKKPAEDSGHIFTVTLLKIPLGQVSAFMDFWEKTWVPLEKQDPDLISSTVLRHRYGPTDYTVFLIQEFKDLASVEASRNREEGPLQRQASSDPAAAEAMKSFTTFVDGHVDYILYAPDRLRK